MKRLTIIVLAFLAGWLCAESHRPIVIRVVQIEDADAFDPDPTVHQL